VSDITKLQAAAVREAAMQDAFVLVFEAELRSVINRFLRRLKAELADWDVDDDGRLVSELANLGRAIGFRKDLGIWLEQEGFHALAAKVLDEPLDKLAASVLANSVAKKAATLAPAGFDVLSAFKELRLADLLDVGESLSRLLAARALEGVLGMRPVAALVQDFADVAGLSERQARTLYDTAVSTYTRQVEQLHASGAAEELFVYVGPADSAMREFCRKHIGKVYPRESIDEMDNGQLPNVLLTGGGYQCRHTWKRVSVLDDELIALSKSGKRVPEIQAALTRLEAA
jgi:hypothetical protein